jgi:RecA/RadA recombinase
VSAAKKSAGARKRAPAPVPAPVNGKTRIRVTDTPAGNYFASGADKPDSDLEFIPTGCSVLDEALSGGIALGRTVNIVGDKSAGKTLLAMEITANFHTVFAAQGARSRYAESEAAFDKPYAGALGMPVDLIEFNNGGKPLQTVEDLYDDMVRFMDENPGVPKLYIIDSLDALSDDEEMEAAFDKDSFGGKKPKLIGQLFRRLIDRMEEEKMAFVVVSQIRDVMNAGPFQEKTKRSGGRALDFYATHIIWLNEMGKIKRTMAKIDRIVGVDVRARIRKNKVGLPFRECEYPVLFGYGIDDMMASAKWLVENHREAMLTPLGMSKAGYPVMIPIIRDRGGDEAREMRASLAKIVRREWQIIETGFLPKAKKY